MAIVRRMDTPESREYWQFIEEVSREVRGNRMMHFSCGDGKRCQMGDGKESCDQVVAAATDPLVIAIKTLKE